ARAADVGPATLGERFQIFFEVEAEPVVLAFEVEPAAELGRLHEPHVVAGIRLWKAGVVIGGKLRIGAAAALFGIGEGIVAEQVAQAHDHRVDIGEAAALPDEEDVAVADLEELALELPDQAVEFARRYAQLVIAPVARLEAGQMEMDDPPVVVVALQLAHESGQLGLDGVVLGCLHVRLGRPFLLRWAAPPPHGRSDRTRRIIMTAERSGSGIGPTRSAGSTASSNQETPQCRCGPVALPVAPTVPSGVPGDRRCPTSTSTSCRCT